MSVLWTILIGAASFIAGWVLASEKVRLEAFKRKLDVYEGLGKLAGELLVLNIKAEQDYDNYMIPMVEHRLVIGEYMIAHNLFVTKEVGSWVAKMTDADDKADAEKIRPFFNELIQAMAKELRLKAMHVVTSALSNPLSLLEHLRSEKK
jgi:hypothetical protein